MTNPYAVQSRGGTPRAAISRLGWLGFGLFCSTVTAAIVTVIGVQVIPDFAEVFAGFGASLPVLTRVVVSGYPLVWLAPVLVALQGWIGPGGPHRHRLAAVLGMATPILVGPAILFGLYLPIFRMGSLV